MQPSPTTLPCPTNLRRARSAPPSAPTWPDTLFAAAGSTFAVGSGPAALRTRGRERLDLDHRRWHAEADEADLDLLVRARGPVLDIGCGPGRLTRALVVAGKVALGIDTSEAAVAAARWRGAPAVHASVFGPVPAAGHWGSALLVDGNIGIGGDAGALLRRARSLVAPGGRMLVEVGPPGTPTGDVEVRVEHAGSCGPWFRWSRVAAPDLPALARAAGATLECVWSQSGRWFAEMERT